jgi:uncharacterized protein (DUF433 family)
METTLTTSPNPAGPSMSREHIVSSPDTCRGQPRIAGTRIRVKDVVIWHERMGWSPEEIVSEWPHLTLGDVYAALTYYDDHRDRIDAEMKTEEDFAADLEVKTSLTLRKPAGRDATVDTPPSR